MRRILLLIFALAVLGVAGCGGDDNDNGSAATTGGSAEGGEVEIKMENIQFAPKETTVKVGDTVKWVNEDTVDHNVVAESGADFKSDDFGKDGTFEFTADKAGTIKYVCTLHPGMDATLTVE